MAITLSSLIRPFILGSTLFLAYLSLQSVIERQEHNQDVLVSTTPGNTSIFERTEGAETEPIIPDNALFKDAVQKGCENLGMMSGDPFPEQNKFTQASFTQYGWQVESNPKFGEEILEYPKSLKGWFNDLHIGHNFDANVVVYADHMRGGVTEDGPYHKVNGHYYNAFNPGSGVITSLSNISPREAQQESEDTVHPPLVRFSDIMGIAWGVSASEMEKNGEKVSPLDFWFRVGVKRGSKTREIMKQVIQRHGAQADPPHKYLLPPRSGGWYFSVEEDMGKALMGTPHGNGIAWALASNHESFGRRIVTRIAMFRLQHFNFSTFEEETTEADSKWCLLFVIDKLPESATHHRAARQERPVSQHAAALQPDLIHAGVTAAPSDLALHFGSRIEAEGTGIDPVRPTVPNVLSKRGTLAEFDVEAVSGQATSVWHSTAVRKRASPQSEDEGMEDEENDEQMEDEEEDEEMQDEQMEDEEMQDEEMEDEEMQDEEMEDEEMQDEAMEEEEMEDDEILELVEGLEVSLEYMACKGVRNSNMMSGKSSPPQNRFAEADLVRNGWAESAIARLHHDQVVVPPDLRNYFKSLKIAKAWYEFQIRYADLIRAPVVQVGQNNAAAKGHYYNAFNIPYGVIISLRNLSPLADSNERHLPDSIVPALHRLSDVVGIQWKKLAQEYTKRGRSRPVADLRYWFRVNIPEDSLTWLVMKSIVINLGRESGQEYPPPLPGWTLSVDEWAGQALLGTPHGNGVAWALASNHQTFGGPRIVSRVTMFVVENHDLEGSDKVPLLWCLLFHIAPLDTQRGELAVIGSTEVSLAAVAARTLGQAVPGADMQAAAAYEGTRSLALLQGPRPGQNSFTLQSYRAHGWRVTDIKRLSDGPSIVRMSMQRFGAIVANLSLAPEWRNTHALYVDRFGPEGKRISDAGHYYNAISLEAGVVLSVSNYSPLLDAVVGQNNESPPDTFHNIMGAVWEEANELETQIREPLPQKPLRYWLIEGIPADSRTRAIMQAVVLGRIGRKRSPPVYPGLRFSVAQEEGQALLGTPYGGEIALTLATNNFGVGKTISHVSIFRPSPNSAKLNAWCLMFEIVDIQDQPQLPPLAEQAQLRLEKIRADGAYSVEPSDSPQAGPAPPETP